MTDYSSQLAEDNKIDWQALESDLVDYFLFKDVPVRDDSVVELENQLYYGKDYRTSPEIKGLVGWSRKHDAQYDDLSAIPFHPSNATHRIETVETEASKLPIFIPRLILVPIMRAIYLKTLGERGANALAAFDQTPAQEGSTVEAVGSVADEIGEILFRGETIVDATAHAESLEDVATYGGLVAISAARKRSRFIRLCGFSLSKTLVLEDYKGKRVIDRTKFFGKNYLTIPSTETLNQFDLPEDGVFSIRRKVTEAIANDRDGRKTSPKENTLRKLTKFIFKTGGKKGMAFTVAPSGKAANKNPGKDNDGHQKEGPETLHQSAMTLTTANLISKFDHYIVTSEWDKQVAVSSIFKLTNLKGLKQRERKDTIMANANTIHTMLAKQTANLAQVPVTYEHFIDDGEFVIKKTMLPQSPSN